MMARKKAVPMKAKEKKAKKAAEEKVHKVKEKKAKKKLFATKKTKEKEEEKAAKEKKQKNEEEAEHYMELFEKMWQAKSPAAKARAGGRIPWLNRRLMELPPDVRAVCYI